MGRLKPSGVRYANVEPHHSQPAYQVFYFYRKDQADYFVGLLKARHIPFERGMGKDLIRRHLIGIHTKYLEEAKCLNDEAGAHFRKPFLGSITARNLILLFTLVVVLLALIGYLSSL